MKMSANECMAKALEMDAKAAGATYEPAKVLYRLLANEWRYSHDQAIRRDSMRPHESGCVLDTREPPNSYPAIIRWTCSNVL
jgi:hypothetical protein